MNKQLLKRFIDLENEMKEVENSKYRSTTRNNDSEYVKNELFLKWKIKTKSLIDKLCGQDSDYYKDFIKTEKPSSFTTNLYMFNSLQPLFLALKEDFENGYLTSFRTLIQAEIFENELEQATELLKSGYYLASAVIAGVVLENGLRELCDREKIDSGKLDKMNSDLVKSGVYNKLQQKRITALADIRNSAAHGKPEEFTKEDVLLMIRDIEQFLINQLD